MKSPAFSPTTLPGLESASAARKPLLFRDSITVIRPLGPRTATAPKRPCGLGWVRRRKTEPQLPSTIVEGPSYALEPAQAAEPPPPSGEPAPSSQPPGAGVEGVRPPLSSDPPMPEETLRLPLQARAQRRSRRKLARRGRPNERLATLLVVLSVVEAVALAVLLLVRS